ncbi:hypothetical protein NEMIN01_0946 [Nematocida minor]|uniref:uncharacterized protein n=1 Tax=Nematocida minor TaxID=1912983 RepID=UPI00221EF410|nr:uncharacterized protein NEMIN01_0946 [Nematocida minor]KAI5190247.1 hypothetical protein NEMIN01_0946 [Nematocida minor]
MDEDLLLSFSDDADKNTEESSLLKKNKALQSGLHREYLDLVSKMDTVQVLRKHINSFKKKTRKRTRTLQLAKKDSYRMKLVKIEDEETPVALKLVSDINVFLVSKKITAPAISDNVWRSVAERVKAPIHECMSLWYHPHNPIYRKDKFQPEEDREILKNEGDWAKVYTQMRRAPITIYSRYLELQKSRPTSQWDPEEDVVLASLVQKEGKQSWTEIATYFKNKTPKQCMYRYKRVLNPEIKHGKWSKEEDDALLEAVEKCKKGNWKQICKYIPGRTQFQCRERYLYHIDPNINNNSWTEEEDAKLLDIVSLSEKHVWTKISKEFVNRSDRQCRVRYYQLVGYCTSRKKKKPG